MKRNELMNISFSQGIDEMIQEHERKKDGKRKAKVLYVYMYIIIFSHILLTSQSIG